MYISNAFSTKAIFLLHTKKNLTLQKNLKDLGSDLLLLKERIWLCFHNLHVFKKNPIPKLKKNMKTLKCTNV